MTHSAHPYGQRIGIIRGWQSSWFASNKKNYNQLIKEDFILRSFLEKHLKGKGVGEISIKRIRDSLEITIGTARPGLVIGRSGEGIKHLTSKVQSLVKKHNFKTNQKVQLKIEEIKFLETNALVVAESIEEALLKRMAFRRVIKQTAEKVMANQEVDGVRILLSGRLGGVDIARREQIKKGRIPLQTLTADIDYAKIPAVMPYGTTGIKVWIYKKKNK